jgi:hypothetical protein
METNGNFEEKKTKKSKTHKKQKESKNHTHIKNHLNKLLAMLKIDFSFFRKPKIFDFFLN